MFAQPGEVATDGGPVFKGAFHDTVERLGIEHRYPSGPPNRRATVESSFKQLKAFCRRFTGQSFSIFGDGRQKIEKAPDHWYHVICLDAFSSDAIPVHLLTVDAVKIYLKKLAPGGVLVFKREF